MQNAKLNEMLRGWFIGPFEPSSYKTENCEVAVKNYLALTKEPKHYHKVATEITLILSGEVRMLDKVWRASDIIVIFPEEVTEFEALTDAQIVVVKIPAVKNDKYYVHS